MRLACLSFMKSKSFIILGWIICFITFAPAYAQSQRSVHAYTTPEVQPRTSDQIYRQTSQIRMGNEAKTNVLTESLKIKDDPIKMLKYGQFPENRGAALNYIGAMCDAGKQKEEHLEAIRYVIKHESDTAVLALAFSYLGFCNNNAETDSKLFDMIKIGVQIDKVQKASSILPNVTDLIPFVDKYTPIKDETERTYVLINGAIKGLVLSKTAGSTGLLEKLNQHYISNKNAMRRSDYELDSYISRIQANLLEGIASKIQNYGNKSALDYFNKQITYTNSNSQYDRVSKGLITISLAQMDCRKASLWDSFKPGCVEVGNSNYVIESLKNIVASSAWPVEFRAMAYKYLIKYVPESEVMGVDGKIKTLVGNRNYKAEINFALEEKKLTEGTESMMAFIASWFALDAIAVEAIPRTIPIFKKLHGLVKEIFPEIGTIGEAENMAVKTKNVAAVAKNAEDKAASKALDLQDQAQQAQKDQKWIEEAKQGLHNETWPGRQYYEVEQKTKINLGKGEEGQKATDELLAPEIQQKNEEANPFTQKKRQTTDLDISIQGKQLNIKIPQNSYGGGYYLDDINKSATMKQILTESADIIKQKTGILIGENLTLEQEKLLIQTIREDIIPKYASDRSNIIFKETGGRDYSEYTKIKHNIKGGIGNAEKLAQVLLNKGGVCEDLSMYNTILLRLYNVKTFYVNVGSFFGPHAVAGVILKDGSNWILDSNMNGGYFLPKTDYLNLKTKEGKTMIHELDPLLDESPHVRPEFWRTIRI